MSNDLLAWLFHRILPIHPQIHEKKKKKEGKMEKGAKVSIELAWPCYSDWSNWRRYNCDWCGCWGEEYAIELEWMTI